MNINFCRSNTNALKSWSETNQCAILHSPEREARRRKTELIKQLIREMTVARLYGIKQTLPPSEAARKINYLTRCVPIYSKKHKFDIFIRCKLPNKSHSKQTNKMVTVCVVSARNKLINRLIVSVGRNNSSHGL